jgi:Xaa-Pro aminopeptidase
MPWIMAMNNSFLRSRRVAYALSVGLILLAIGPGRAQQTVTVGQTFLAAAIDPAKGAAGWALTSHGVGQTLFTVDRAGRIAPLLAEKAEALDARTWTIRLKPGLVVAIEPMINAGGPDVEVLDDGWTAVTRDRMLSAHFEHSVAITENGPVVLSRR